MKKLTLLLLAFFLMENLVSQNLYLDAMVTKDSIIMRWAPTTLEGFENGLNNGYALEVLPWESTNCQLVKTIVPTSASETESIILENENDDAAIVAAYYRFNESEETSLGFSSFIDGVQHQNDKMLNLNLILTSADISKNAAVILGLRYEFPNTNPNQKAIYRLRSLGEGKQDTASYFFSTELSHFPKIENLTFQQKGEVVVLSWDNLMYQDYYTAYEVSRSSHLGEVYEKVSEVPIFQADMDAEMVVFKDSVTIGSQYYYRVHGITAFGTRSENSDPYEVKVVNQKVNYKALGMKARGNHEKIKVEWEAEVGGNIRSVVLLKSNFYDGPYHEIGKGRLSTSSKVFEDKDLKNERNHYYRIAAQNNDGFWYYSNPIRAVYEDEVPPAIPAEVIGTVDSTGICYLHWKANEEVDIKGYRVYKSNRKDGTFYHAHDLLNYTNTFIDTVGLDYLTEDLYYKIVAVDYDNNHSEYSELTTLTRPDLVAPVASQIYNYQEVDHGLKLLIHKSPSRDVTHCYLVKSLENSKDTLILEIDKDQSFFVDQSFKAGKVATYHLKTVDDAGNIALSRSVEVRTRGNESAIKDIKALYDEGSVKLTWTISNNEKGELLLYLKEVKSDSYQYFSKLPSEVGALSLPWTGEGEYQVACILLSEQGKRYPPVFSNSIIIQ